MIMLLLLCQRLATVVLVIILASCAKGIAPEIAVHGNFCGPNHPAIPRNGIGRGAWIETLKSMAAYDTLDDICKGHDICYARGEINKRVCDSQFLDELSTLKPDTTMTREKWDYCKTKKIRMWMAIWGKPIGDADLGLVGDAVNLPSRMIVGSMLAAPLALNELTGNQTMSDVERTKTQCMGTFESKILRE